MVVRSPAHRRITSERIPLMSVSRFLQASRRYFFSSVVATSAATVPAAVLGAPTEGLVTGHTVVRLSHRFVNEMNALQLLFESIHPGKLENDVAVFPITAGTMDFANAKGEVLHQGGVSISAGPVIVSLRDFSIDTTTPRPLLTGMMVVNSDLVGRMPLFDLALPALDLPLDHRASIVEIPNVKAILTANAAAALNGVFGVKSFAAGFDFGTAKIKALVAPMTA
jgi:hypothetical protein